MKLGRADVVYPRVEMEGTAVIHDSRKIAVLEIVNLSESGVFLGFENSKGKARFFKPGQSVWMTLMGPRFQMPVKLSGKIARTQKRNPRGVAIEFARLTQDTRIRLKASVEEVRTESALNEMRKSC